MPTKATIYDEACGASDTPPTRDGEEICPACGERALDEVPFLTDDCKGLVYVVKCLACGVALN